MPLRWAVGLAGRPLSRVVAAPAQSWVPERLRELRLRRRSDRYRAALSCTGEVRLPATARLVKSGLTPFAATGDAAGSRRYFFSVRIQATRFLTSASDTCAFGGIGIWPQTPTPPFFTL